jgi:hypothetical protein
MIDIRFHNPQSNSLHCPIRSASLPVCPQPPLNQIPWVFSGCIRSFSPALPLLQAATHDRVPFLAAANPSFFNIGQTRKIQSDPLPDFVQPEF